jgi:alkylhydroperoxidase/carboxymuconolactone decarboxylase family protein YurZ
VLRRKVMAFIRTVSETEASGKLRELYDGNMANNGYVRNSMKALSLRPEAIDAWQKLLSAIRSPMDARRYELITIAAAAALRCSY